MLSPVVDLTAALRRAHYAANAGKGEPLDVDVTARYDGQRGTASVKARNAQHELLDLEAQAQAAVAQLLDGSAVGGNAAPAWTASARAHLTGFPLSSIAALDDKLVSGELSGDVALVDLHANARADAALTIDALRVGSFTYKSAGIQLKAGRMVATLDGVRSASITRPTAFLETKAHRRGLLGGQPGARALDPRCSRWTSICPPRTSASQRCCPSSTERSTSSTDDSMPDGERPASTRRRTRRTPPASFALESGDRRGRGRGGSFVDVTASVKLAGDGTDHAGEAERPGA